MTKKTTIHNITPTATSQISVTASERPDIVEVVTPFPGAQEWRRPVYREPVTCQITVTMTGSGNSLSWLVTPSTDHGNIASWLSVWSARGAIEARIADQCRVAGVPIAQTMEVAEAEATRASEDLEAVAVREVMSSGGKLGTSGAAQLWNAARAYAAACDQLAMWRGEL